MSLWLTPEELYERTGKRQKKRQRLELARQGVRFTTRSDGFPLVDRAQFESGEPLTKARRRREPNFTAIGRA